MRTDDQEWSHVWSHALSQTGTDGECDRDIGTDNDKIVTMTVIQTMKEGEGHHLRGRRLKRSGMDPPLRSSRRCLHTAFIAISVPFVFFWPSGLGEGGCTSPLLTASLFCLLVVALVFQQFPTRVKGAHTPPPPPEGNFLVTQ